MKELMASVEPDQQVQTIVAAVSRSEKPVTLSALRKRAGTTGFDEALATALQSGLIHEHPKARSRLFGKEAWRPEPRILALCGRKALTLSDLGAQVRALSKKQLEEVVRGLMAEGKLAPLHTYRGSSLKRSGRFATPALCQDALERTIREVTDYYRGLGVTPGGAGPAPEPASDVEAVKASLQALEQREAAAVVIADVRRKSGLPKEQFDHAVLELYRTGVVVLHRHDAPFLISEPERNELLTDGEGRYYVGISWTHAG